MSYVTVSLSCVTVSLSWVGVYGIPCFIRRSGRKLVLSTDYSASLKSGPGRDVYAWVSPRLEFGELKTFNAIKCKLLLNNLEDEMKRRRSFQDAKWEHLIKRGGRASRRSSGSRMWIWLIAEGILTVFVFILWWGEAWGTDVTWAWIRGTLMSGEGHWYSCQLHSRGFRSRFDLVSN